LKLHLNGKGGILKYSYYIIAIAGILIVGIFNIPVSFTSSGGITNYSGNPLAGGGASCSSCHSGGVLPSVSITGPTNVQPSSTSTYTFTITGGQQNIGGLDMSTEGGTLISTQANTRLLSGELTHQQPAAAAANGNVSWSFDWQAPAAGGNYTLYGAGLSADANGSTSGDGGSTAVLLVTVSTGAAQAPVAAIKAPLTAPVATSVTFDGSGSTDVDGTIAQYDWDFGDGTVATGAIATHSFTAAGTYTTTLKVTDDANLTNTTFVDITIGGAMIPSANPGGPYTGEPTVVINFDATGSTHDSAITRYLWDYGDGTAFETTTTPTGSHTYATQGSYTLTVAVQDASFMTGVAATTVTIAGAPPPTTGEEYYNAYCLSCHGPNGNGGKYEEIRNESASDINKAIAKEPLMQSIVLPGGAAELIAEFLADKKMK